MLKNREVTKKISGKLVTAEVTPDNHIISERHGDRKIGPTKYTTDQWKNALEFLFNNEGKTFGERRSKNHIGNILSEEEISEMKCVCLASMTCPKDSYQMFNQNQGGQGDMQKYAQKYLPKFEYSDMYELYDHVHFNPSVLKPFVYIRPNKSYSAGFLCKKYDILF